MMQLTHSQHSAIDAFKSFLESGEQVFMLKGAAGTGKTTLVSEFLKILDKEKYYAEIMAPTGRAAYIIGKNIGRPAFTIHKNIYGLQSLKSTSQNKEEEDDGRLHARYNIKPNKDIFKTIYIVDEASMVSDAFSENEAFSFGSGKLLTDLFEYAQGRKIVFVGDYAQLPPVGMNFSPALDKNYIEQKFDCKTSEYILREVLRQSNNSIMLANATKIRDSIEARTFIEFKLEEGEDAIAEHIDLLNPYFNLSESKPDIKTAIIAYSNRQALQYNLAVRRHYYGDNPPRLVKGDLLMIARNNYSYGEELFNGNIVQVESCMSDDETEKRNVTVKLGKDRFESVTLTFRRATIRFGVNGKAVSQNVMLLDNFLDDPSGSLGGLLNRALIVDFNNRIPIQIKESLPEIKRILRAKKELSILQKELWDSYIKLLAIDPYYNAVICKYGYAMTCHKAQGGEWENVLVDMCRFGGTANEDYFRWAYTALTRASKKLWFYRPPEFNYISNLVVEHIQHSKDIKVSIHSTGNDFCQARFNRIRNMCDKIGIYVREERSRSYQHWLIFSGQHRESATYILWYKAKGYNGREVLHHSSSDEFANICRNIINLTFAPEDVSFFAPGRPFAEKLVAFIKSQIEELDIQLLDITQEHYQDVFHLKTDGLAKMSLYYTANGNYTYMRLQSSVGQDDTKLEALRKRFI